MPHADDIATGLEGLPEPELRIAGRPRPGSSERYLILEEPGAPVQTHYVPRLNGTVPHFKRYCPHCRESGIETPKPMWYIGAACWGGERAILELSRDCFRTLSASARAVTVPGKQMDLFGERVGAVSFVGLVVEVSRQKFQGSRRVLRCESRLATEKLQPWDYHTRRELARIWRVPVMPKIFRATGG